MLNFQKILLSLAIAANVHSFSFCSLQGVSEPEKDLPNATTSSEPTILLKTEWNVRYSEGTEPLQVGDLFRPKAIEDQPSQRAPAVLMIHGGAWTTGSKLHTMRHAKNLAARGYVVFSINYRLAPKHRFPAQLNDCQLALKWLVENAERLQIDTSKLGVWGYSAGGHLAALLALKANSTPPSEQNWKVSACVCGGTPFNLFALTNGGKVLDSVFVINPADRMQALADASPSNHLESPNLPPFFLFHGTADMLVPLDQSVKMEQALRTHGGECELLTLQDKGHLTAFFANEAISKSFEFLDRKLEVDSAWLEEQGRGE